MENRHCYLTIGLLPLPSGAAASGEEVVCGHQPKEKWANADAISEKLSRLIDREFVLGVDKGCYEAKVIVNGVTAIDIYIDPVTAEIVKVGAEGDSDS